MKAKEIIGLMPITPVPQTPAFVKGVINLRGKVVPVVDLRLRFNMEKRKYDERTCVIIVEVKGKTATRQMGVIVDAVSEVLRIKGEHIEDVPEFGDKLDTRYVLSIAKTEGGVKILLDIDGVLTKQIMAGCHGPG